MPRWLASALLFIAGLGTMLVGGGAVLVSVMSMAVLPRDRLIGLIVGLALFCLGLAVVVLSLRRCFAGRFAEPSEP